MLKIASWDSGTRNWEAYIKESITAYVDVIKGTDGFDSCPHGTLNFNASEYSCYASGVQHQPGAAYDYKEYPYGSRMRIRITKNGVGWNDASMSVFGLNTRSRYGKPTGDGWYDFGYVANDTYYVFVNGDQTGKITVNAAPKTDEAGFPGSRAVDGFYYITDQEFTGSFEFHTMKALTYLNPDKEAEVSPEPGEIMFLHGGSVYSKGYSEAERKFWGANDKPYNIQVGPADTGHTIGSRGDREGAGDLETVSFYKMKVSVNSDNPCTSFSDANVSLRNDKGEIMYVMNYDESQSRDKTAVFTVILQAEEDRDYNEKAYAQATPYRVYINGQDTHRVLKRVGRTEDMEEGFYPYETTVDYYKAQLTVKKDEAIWNEASATLDNGVEHYVMIYNAATKKYEADVLVSSFSNGTEKPYTLKVEGGTDTGAATQLKSNAKTTTYDFYTVNYYSYEKANEKATSYVVKTTPNRTQVVRKGSKTSAASDMFVDGLSFCWYSATKWNNGDAFPEFAYDSTPITGKLNLYAQFAQPTVKVGEFVAKSNTTFMLDNLTINGFGTGNTAIKSVQIQTKNVKQVKFSDVSDVSATQGTGEGLGSGNVATNNIINITFTSGKSMSAAQKWLREKLVFTPDPGKTCEVKITASDGIITNGSTDNPGQSQANVTATELTDNMNNLNSGYYYLTQNRSYSGGGDSGALRIGYGQTVTIYIPQGVTLTATGSNASGRTGAGAGIFVPYNSTLILVGKGTVNATGGNAAGGSNGTGNVADAYVKNLSEDWYHGGTGGDGGNGGGGAGAGIGGYGGTGGAGNTGAAGSSRRAYGNEPQNQNGSDGNPGGNGDKGKSGGTIIIGQGMNVSSRGGNADGLTGGAAGTWNTSESKIDNTNYRGTDGGSDWDDNYSAAAGGAGGGGGAGGPAFDFGGGGAGGGAGGAGGGGGTHHWAKKNGRKWLDGGGGGGGNSVVSGGRGGDGSGGSGYAAGGAGGSAGTTASAVDPVRNYTTGSITKYTVKFGNTKTYNYDYGFGASITNIPDYSAPSGRYFLGWKVTRYGKYMGRTGGTQPLTSAETKLYQPGDSINITEGTYGNIELTPITREKTGICAEDVNSMFFKSGYVAPSYFDYKITTKLDGEATNKMGALKLVNGSDVRYMAPDEKGVYTMRISVKKLYDIYSVNYPEFDTSVLGKLRDSGTDSNRTLDFTGIEVEVNGYDKGVVTLKLAGTNTPGPKLALNKLENEGKDNSKAIYRHIAYGKPADIYDVYIDDKDLPFYGGTAKKAAYGKDKRVVVDFSTNTVNITTNTVITQAELRELDGASLMDGGESLTLIQTKDNNKKWYLRKLKSNTEYALFLNGVAAGVKTDFSSSHELSPNLYLLGVNTYINDKPADVSDVLILGDNTARISEGKYQLQTIKGSEETVRDVYVGSTPVGYVRFTDTIEGSTLKADFYTVSYTNNEIVSGNKFYLSDKDTNIYFKGSDVAVADDAGAKPNGMAIDKNKTPSALSANEVNSYFYGWKSADGSIYMPGVSINSIGQGIEFTSVWALFSTTEARWVINGKTHYGTLDEALAAANDENTSDIDIYVQNPATLTTSATLPAYARLTVETGKTLYEKTTDESTGAETDTGVSVGVTEGGHLTIANGVTLTNYGTVENNNKLTVDNGGVLLNKLVLAKDKVTKNGANFKNTTKAAKGLKVMPEKDGLPAGRIINEGFYNDNGNSEIPPDGLENEGDAECEAPGGALGDPGAPDPLGGLEGIDYDDPVVIRLNGDITLKDTLDLNSDYFNGKPLVLDLRGHELTGPTVSGNTKATVRVIGNTGLTIIDSIGGGSIRGGNGISGNNDNPVDGTIGNPGLDAAGGSVIVESPVRIYGGTGGMGISGKNGGEGGSGAILTGGTLTIEKGALIQGGDGGDAIAVVSGNGLLSELGKGGKAGTGITGTQGKLDNQGSSADVPEDPADPDKEITVRPGHPGKGYKYTPPKYDGDTGITPGIPDEDSAKTGDPAPGKGDGVPEDNTVDLRQKLEAKLFNVTPGYVVYNENEQEPLVKCTLSGNTFELNGLNPSTITVSGDAVVGHVNLGAVTIKYYIKNNETGEYSLLPEKSDGTPGKPKAVGMYQVRVQTTGVSENRADGYRSASDLKIGTYEIVPPQGETPLALGGNPPKIDPAPQPGEEPPVSNSTCLVTINDCSNSKVTNIKIDDTSDLSKVYETDGETVPTCTITATVADGCDAVWTKNGETVEFDNGAYSFAVTEDTEFTVTAVSKRATAPELIKTTGQILTEGYGTVDSKPEISVTTKAAETGENLTYKWYKGTVSDDNIISDIVTTEDTSAGTITSLYTLPSGVSGLTAGGDDSKGYGFWCVITSERADNHNTATVTVPVDVTIIKKPEGTKVSPTSGYDDQIEDPEISYDEGKATVSHNNTDVNGVSEDEKTVSRNYVLYYTTNTEAADPSIDDSTAEEPTFDGWTKADSSIYTSEVLTASTTYKAFVLKKTETHYPSLSDNTISYTLSRVVSAAYKVEEVQTPYAPTTQGGEPQPEPEYSGGSADVEMPSINIVEKSTDGNSAGASISVNAVAPEGWTLKTYYTVNGTDPKDSGNTSRVEYTASSRFELHEYTHIKAVNVLTKSGESDKTSVVAIRTFIPRDVLMIETDSEPTACQIKPLKPGKAGIKVKVPPTASENDIQEEVGIDFEVTENTPGSPSNVKLGPPLYTIPYGIKGVTITGASSSSKTEIVTVDSSGKLTTVKPSSADNDVAEIKDSDSTKIATVKVVPRPITIAPNSNNITYGDDVPDDSSYTYTVKGGLAEGDAVDSVSINRIGEGTKAGTYTLSANNAKIIDVSSNDRSDYYNITYGTGSELVIAKRKVVVTGIKAEDKFYDGTAAANLVTVSDPENELDGTRVTDREYGTVYNHKVTIPDGQTYTYESHAVGTWKIALKDENDNFLYEVNEGNDEAVDPSQPYVYGSIKRHPLDDPKLGSGIAEDVTFNGRNRFPEKVTFTLSGNGTPLTLYRNVDYVVKDAGYRDAGTHTVSINGVGNYTATATVSFNILPKNITGASIKLDDRILRFNDRIQTKRIEKVSVDGLVLKEGIDYTIVDDSNRARNAGDHTITIRGVGNYIGDATASFNISQISRGTRTVEVVPVPPIVNVEEKPQEIAFIVNVDGYELKDDEYKITGIRRDGDTDWSASEIIENGHKVRIPQSQVGEYSVKIQFTNYSDDYVAVNNFSAVSGKVIRKLTISSNNLNIYDPETETVLTAVTDLDDDNEVTIKYIWYRDGIEMEGSVSRNYILKADDVGSVISVKTTANGLSRTASTPKIIQKPHAETDPVHKIEGHVRRPASSDSTEFVNIPGARVELRLGSTVLASAVTDTDGNYSFGSLVNGEYNIVVTDSKEGEEEARTKTAIAVIENEDQTVDVIMPYLSVNSKVVVTGETPAVVVGGFDEATEKSVTPEEKEAGAEVTMTMTVESLPDLTKINDRYLTSENRIIKYDQVAIKDAAGIGSESAGRSIDFMDMSVERTVSGDSAQIEPKTETVHEEFENVLEVIVPFRTTGRQSFRVYRRHMKADGIYDAVENFTRIARRPAKSAYFTDGEFYVGDNFIVIYLNKCSAYAIAYREEGYEGKVVTPEFTLTDNSSDKPGSVIAEFTPKHPGEKINAGYITEDGFWHPIEGTFTIGPDGRATITGLPAGKLEIRIRLAETDLTDPGDWKAEEITIGAKDPRADFSERSYVIHYILEYNGKQMTESSTPIGYTEVITHKGSNTDQNLYYGISARKEFFERAADDLFKTDANPNDRIISYTIIGKAVYLDGTPVLDAGSKNAYPEFTQKLTAEEFVDDKSTGTAYDMIPFAYNDIYVYANVGAYATDMTDNGVMVTAPVGVKYTGLAHKISVDPAAGNAGAAKKASYDLDITITDTKLRNGNEDYRLVYGKDYTVSYRNNMNASVKVSGAKNNAYYTQIYDESRAASKWPQIIIKGKGNYSGMKLTVYYDILPASLNESNANIGVFADAVKDSYKLKKRGGIDVKPVPSRYGRTFDPALNRFVDNKAKKISYRLGKEVTVELQKWDEAAKEWKRLGDLTKGSLRRKTLAQVRNEGFYRAKVSGSGNFYGDVYDEFRVYPYNNILMTSLKVKTAKRTYAAGGVSGNSIVTGIKTKVRGADGRKVKISPADYIVTLLPASESARVSTDGSTALSAGRYTVYVSPKDAEDFARKYPGVSVNGDATANVTVKGSKLKKGLFTFNWNRKGEVADGKPKDIVITLNGINADDLVLGKTVVKNGKTGKVGLSDEECKRAYTVSGNTLTIKGSYELDNGRIIDNTRPGTYSVILYGRKGYADSVYTFKYKRIPAKLTAASLSANETTFNAAGAMTKLYVTLPGGEVRELAGSGDADFKVTYKKNKNVGRAVATVSARNTKNGYKKGSKANVEFAVKPLKVDEVSPYTEYTSEKAGELFIKTPGAVKKGKKAVFTLYQASYDGKKLVKVNNKFYTGSFEGTEKTKDLILKNKAVALDFGTEGVTVEDAYTPYATAARTWTGKGALKLDPEATLIKDTGNRKVYTSDDLSVTTYIAARVKMTDNGKGGYDVAYAGSCYILPVIPELTVDGKTLKLADGDYTISYKNNHKVGTGKMIVTLSQSTAEKYDIGGNRTYSFRIVKQTNSRLTL